jgi:hypothetical protein
MAKLYSKNSRSRGLRSLLCFFNFNCLFYAILYKKRTFSNINNNGITTENCLSYKGYENNCVIKCDINDIPFNKYYSGQTKFLENENEIKKEILKNGPVTSMMNLYTDYYDYTSGIYIHNTKYNNVLGYHSITIMGWGIDNGIKYWLIQDSHGKYKGDNGFIKIKIGDDCGAGATAFCDEKEGKYNEYKSDDNNRDKDTDENPKIVPKKAPPSPLLYTPCSLSFIPLQVSLKRVFALLSQGT